MNIYINAGRCTNLVVDGRAAHVKAGEIVHCEQEINNPEFHKITPEQEKENQKTVANLAKQRELAQKQLSKNKKESKNNE